VSGAGILREVLDFLLPNRPRRVCPHKHVWERISLGKRRCACGAEEWLFTNPYPAIGEPAHTWRDMTPVNLKDHRP